MNGFKQTATVYQQVAKIPLTLSIGVAAIVIASVPTAGELLQFDRAQVAAGEIWRLATGHLTHWNAEHLQWDLLMFMVLGVACELRHPRRMRLCVVAAAATVSLLVLWVFPGIDYYRGLSGIDTALFTLLAIDLMCDARRQQSGVLAAVTGGLLLGLAAKTAYEALTGQTLFVDEQSAGFELLVGDHIAAAAVGTLLAIGIGPLHNSTDEAKRCARRLLWLPPDAAA